MSIQWKYFMELLLSDSNNIFSACTMRLEREPQLLSLLLHVMTLLPPVQACRICGTKHGHYAL